MGRTLWYFNREVSYPFGFGLSYTTFAYSNFRISKSAITPNDKVTVSVDVTNTGAYSGDDITNVRAVISGIRQIRNVLKRKLLHARLLRPRVTHHILMIQAQPGNGTLLLKSSRAITVRTGFRQIRFTHLLKDLIRQQASAVSDV